MASTTTLAQLVDALRSGRRPRRRPLDDAAITKDDIIFSATPHELSSIPITNIVTDSRRVTPGVLFVAIVGHHADGHDYLPQAVEAGASAVVVEAGRHLPAVLHDADIPILTTPATGAALATIARAFFDDPLDALRIVGITGTNGKTTTSYILEAMLDAGGVATGVIGTVNYRWPGVTLDAPNTTPDALTLNRVARRMVDDGVEALVMEVSSHGLATDRMRDVVVDAAILTNLTQDHLDFHGTMQHYRAAKQRLFTHHLDVEDGVAILHVGDSFGRDLATLLGRDGAPRVRTYAADAAVAADVGVSQLRASVDGVTLTGTYSLQSPLLGAFNVANVLAASCAASEVFGLDEATIQRGLDQLGRVPGRLERVRPGNSPAVFVDYAHTPDALERALETLRPHCDADLWCLFGCGGDRDRDKRPIMGHIAAVGADRVVITSDNPRSEDPRAIIEQIAGGVPEDTARDRVVVMPDRAEAIEYAIRTARDEDVVLIAGKGHETYQEIAGARRDFDDRAHARRHLDARQLTPEESS